MSWLWKIFFGEYTKWRNNMNSRRHNETWASQSGLRRYDVHVCTHLLYADFVAFGRKRPTRSPQHRLHTSCGQRAWRARRWRQIRERWKRIQKRATEIQLKSTEENSTENLKKSTHKRTLYMNDCYEVGSSNIVLGSHKYKASQFSRINIIKEQKFERKKILEMSLWARPVWASIFTVIYQLFMDNWFRGKLIDYEASSKIAKSITISWNPQTRERAKTVAISTNKTRQGTASIFIHSSLESGRIVPRQYWLGERLSFCLETCKDCGGLLPPFPSSF